MKRGVSVQCAMQRLVPVSQPASQPAVVVVVVVVRPRQLFPLKPLKDLGAHRTAGRRSPPRVPAHRRWSFLIASSLQSSLALTRWPRLENQAAVNVTNAVTSELRVDSGGGGGRREQSPRGDGWHQTSNKRRCRLDSSCPHAPTREERTTDARCAK